MIAAWFVTTASAAVFAPQPGVPYLYRIEQTRTVSDETRRYVLARRVVFRPLPGGGWLADLTLLSAGGDDSADAATFGRMATMLGGRAIRFRLDGAGTVVEVDDAATVWSALVQAVARGDPTRAGKFAAAAKTLAALPPAMRRQFLFSIMAPMIGADDVARAAGNRAIDIPGSAPAASGVPPLRLPGREIVSRARDGLIDVSLEADSPWPGGRPGTVRLTERRRVDPSSGLVVERRNTRRITIGRQTLIFTTVTTVTRPGN